MMALLKLTLSALGGYVKSIVALGWSIWTCNSKTMQVYADQGSLLGSQETAAGLTRQLAASQSREAALKLALSNEQSSRQNEAKQAEARNVQAASAAMEAQEKVIALFPAHNLVNGAYYMFGRLTYARAS